MFRLWCPSFVSFERKATARIGRKRYLRKGAKSQAEEPYQATANSESGWARCGSSAKRRRETSRRVSCDGRRAPLRRAAKAKNARGTARRKNTVKARSFEQSRPNAKNKTLRLTDSIVTATVGQLAGANAPEGKGRCRQGPPSTVSGTTFESEGPKVDEGTKRVSFGPTRHCATSLACYR